MRTSNSGAIAICEMSWLAVMSIELVTRMAQTMGTLIPFDSFGERIVMAPEQRSTFGRVVRSLRELARRSRSDIAHACFISESQLRNIENGYRSPGPDTLAELERQLNTGGLLADLTTCGDT